MGFGTVWGGFWEGLEALGSSWVVFWPSFFVLVFGMVFKRALGGLWARFWLDFQGFGKDFGRVLRGFWEGFSRILDGSGVLPLFWAVCVFLADFAFFCLLWLALACFGLLWLR